MAAIATSGLRHIQHTILVKFTLYTGDFVPKFIDTYQEIFNDLTLTILGRFQKNFTLKIDKLLNIVVQSPQRRPGNMAAIHMRLVEKITIQGEWNIIHG